MNAIPRLWQLAVLLLPIMSFPAHADDFTVLCQDRAAIEKVYHEHRLGQKPPFEQAMPRELIEQLTRKDLLMEILLRKVYAFVVTPAMIEAEMHRIDTTTRAPAMLAEIKAALDNDPDRIARAFAKPLLVERLLRERFDNDDALHSPQRKIVDGLRGRLLEMHDGGFDSRLAVLRQAQCGEVHDHVAWLMTPRPADVTPNAPVTSALSTKHSASAGAYSIEATLQQAQSLSSPQKDDGVGENYFDELPPKLQALLRAQLQQPGDISAVVETPGDFRIYLNKERTPAQLNAAVFSLRKRAFEDWLADQPDP